MTSLINAVAGTGIVTTSDGSGQIKVQANGVTTNALAWVNFNGTTSPGTIRSAYNVSSVTKNGTGDYTVNFTSAQSDINYSMVGTCQAFASPTASGWEAIYNLAAPTISACRIGTGSSASGTDCAWINVAIFGN